MENIKFHYDREADVMYFSLGLPKKAKTLEIARNEFRGHLT